MSEGPEVVEEVGPGQAMVMRVELIEERGDEALKALLVWLNEYGQPGTTWTIDAVDATIFGKMKGPPGTELEDI